MAKIMCLDVAFAHVGMVILNYSAKAGWTIARAETISTKKSDKKKAVRTADDDVRRTQEIFNKLTDYAEHYGIVGMIAEIPTGGSQNSRASRAMGMASAMAACLAASLDLVCEWTTPLDGKKAMCGVATASKQAMKQTAAKKWPASTSSFKKKRGKDEWSDDYEHVADALGAFGAARNGTVEKLAVQMARLEKEAK